MLGGAGLGPTGLFATMDPALQLAFSRWQLEQTALSGVRWLLKASRSVAFLLNELRD